MFTTPATRRKPLPKTLVGLALALAAAAMACGAQAAAVGQTLVGQTWRVFPDPSAASRDYLGRAQVRAVVWYPAADGVAEKPIAIGPAEAVTFSEGAAAPEAPLARGGKRPLIVMSHGSGGTALQYGWLGDALARRGYIVVAVDHPGASGGERATDAGTALWWRRADDVTAALNGVLKDPVLGPRIDAKRIGVVGYSMGGATGLLLAGAKPNVPAMRAACATIKNAACAMLPTVEDEAVVDRSERRIKAFALIAPGPAPLLDLSATRKALSLVIVGDADVIAPSKANAEVAAAALGARLETFPGVGHNDFLQLCTEAGRTRYAELCKEPNAQRVDTHAKATQVIVRFLEDALR